MNRSRLLSCGLSVAFVGTALAGPLNKSWVAPDSTWVVHVDMEAVQKSAVGTFVSKHRAELDLTDLDKFKSETGIDPWIDVKGVTVYGSRADPEDGVAIVTTTDAIDGALAKLLEKDKRLKKITDAGYTFYTWTEHSGDRYCYVTAGATPRDRTIIAAVAKPLLLEAIKRVETPMVSGELRKEGPLAATPHEGSMLFVSVTSMDTMHLPDSSMMLQKMRAVRVDLGEAKDDMYGEMSVTADTAEDATNLLQMAQGGMAIAKMCAASDPSMCNLAKAAHRIKLSTDEREVRAIFKCPIADVRELLESSMKDETDAPKAESKSGKKDLKPTPEQPKENATDAPGKTPQPM